jgi:hypothetical protein
MKEYITKLNDRNLQRKKATGITNYVLYSLVAIILFKIIDLIPNINYELIERIKFIKVIWYSFCFSLSLYFIYFSFLISFENTSSIRILKYSKESETYFSNIIISCLFLVTIIPALFIIWENYNLNNSNYSALEIVLFILSGINLIGMISLIFSKKKELFQAINKTNNFKITSKIFFIVSFSVVLISNYLLFNIEINEGFNLINLILTCLLIFAVVVIFEKIIESHKGDLFSKDLENLEYEIHLKNFTDESIREILQKKYMGFLIKDWIKFKEKEIETGQKKYENEEGEIEAKEKQLKTVDKEKYPIEYKGREDEVKTLKFNLNKRKLSFLEIHIKEITEILKKDSTIEAKEFNNLKELLSKISSEKK